jgi:hypothetical protein
LMPLRCRWSLTAFSSTSPSSLRSSKWRNLQTVVA